jgi:hypothetical protein
VNFLPQLKNTLWQPLYLALYVWWGAQGAVNFTSENRSYPNYSHMCHGIISIITQIPPYLADTRFNLADTRTTSTTFVHYQFGSIG